MLEKELEEAAQAIHEEMALWQDEVKADPDSVVNTNVYMLDARIMALENLMIEKGVVFKEEVDLAYRRALVERMKLHRPLAVKARLDHIRKQIGIDGIMRIPKGKRHG